MLSAAEPYWRLAIFLGLLIVMLSWEHLAPRRVWRSARPPRLLANITLAAFNTLLLRVLFPLLLVQVAAAVEQLGWGLLNALAWPGALEFFLALVLLDLGIYWQHRLFHHVPTLWRLHRVHHSDLDVDTTTGLRFHPGEAALSMAVKMVLVLALGPSALAVLVFEVLLNATSLFNHGNVALPVSIDRWLRWILVTPDMHRVHHSINATEHNRNFGFNLPWWDRLFGSYRAQPGAGHQDMLLGLTQFRQPDGLGLGKLLLQPLEAVQETPTQSDA